MNNCVMLKVKTIGLDQKVQCLEDMLSTSYKEGDEARSFFTVEDII